MDESTIFRGERILSARDEATERSREIRTASEWHQSREQEMRSPVVGRAAAALAEIPGADDPLQPLAACVCVLPGQPHRGLHRFSRERGRLPAVLEILRCRLCLRGIAVASSDAFVGFKIFKKLLENSCEAAF